jgi:hypothetical protein
MKIPQNGAWLAATNRAVTFEIEGRDRPFAGF